jgi:hypothetical protein
MENILSDIDFAGKLPKAKDEFEKMNEWSLEALACPISHRRDQILGTLSQDHGSIHIVVEWGVFEEFLDKL